MLFRSCDRRSPPFVAFGFSAWLDGGLLSHPVRVDVLVRRQMVDYEDTEAHHLSWLPKAAHLRTRC